ncbi:MAG: hydroxysqualene dehydroxylase HpnE [Micromonosporaceae bacterium]
MTSRHAPHVVVVGGGLAGIAAAIALCDAGVRVTLAEARPRLGGATSSFSRDGLVVDNGQHVFLRCCTSYRDLLGRLGVTAKTHLQDRFDVRVLTESGAARLRRRALPVPLHLAQALATYPLLSRAERAGAVRAALAFLRVDPDDPLTDSQRLGDWLAARGQGPRARRGLWDLFVVSSLNIAGDEASLALAAMVIKTALLGGPGAADIGVPAAPLGELHGQAAATLLRRLGASVCMGAKVSHISPPGNAEGFHVRMNGTDPVGADGVVLAVPPEQAASLFPAAAAGARGTAGDPGTWSNLGESPIVNVHVIYDRPVTELRFAAAVGSPVQWIFDRTAVSGCKQGQYLALSLSAADEYAGKRTRELREQFLPALERLLPAARSASVTDFFVTRERRATFRQVPGTGAFRPGAATALPGLALAGAWTNTGWPDTMEGAVRSGLQAATTILETLGARR